MPPSCLCSALGCPSMLVFVQEEMLAAGTGRNRCCCAVAFEAFGFIFNARFRTAGSLLDCSHCVIVICCCDSRPRMGSRFGLVAASVSAVIFHWWSVSALWLRPIAWLAGFSGQRDSLSLMRGSGVSTFRVRACFAGWSCFIWEQMGFIFDSMGFGSCWLSSVSYYCWGWNYSCFGTFEGPVRRRSWLFQAWSGFYCSCSQTSDRSWFHRLDFSTFCFVVDWPKDY